MGMGVGLEVNQAISRILETEAVQLAQDTIDSTSTMNTMRGQLHRQRGDRPTPLRLQVDGSPLREQLQRNQSRRRRRNQRLTSFHLTIQSPSPPLLLLLLLLLRWYRTRQTTTTLTISKPRLPHPSLPLLRLPPQHLTLNTPRLSQSRLLKQPTCRTWSDSPRSHQLQAAMRRQPTTQPSRPHQWPSRQNLPLHRTRARNPTTSPPSRLLPRNHNRPLQLREPSQPQSPPETPSAPSGHPPAPASRKRVPPPRAPRWDSSPRRRLALGSGGRPLRARRPSSNSNGLRRASRISATDWMIYWVEYAAHEASCLDVRRKGGLIDSGV
jgi:hypothetical protein